MAKLVKNPNIGRNQAKIGPIMMKICPQGDFDASKKNPASDFDDSLNLGTIFQFFVFQILPKIEIWCPPVVRKNRNCPLCHARLETAASGGPPAFSAPSGGPPLGNQR